MEKALGMAVLEAGEQLFDEGGDVRVLQLDHVRFENAHQVVVHVLEDQVERSCNRERIMLCQKKQTDSLGFGGNYKKYLTFSFLL